MPNNKAVEAEISPSAVLAAEFDRDSLSEKTRVHQLAKRLGMVSKDVVVALDGIGLVKVAQSNLSKEEVEKLLDALSQPVLNAAPAAVPDVEPVEKIRRRVEKNVENEIHQIEEKVERELAAVAQPTDFEAAAREEATAELLEDIVPEITPRRWKHLCTRRSLWHLQLYLLKTSKTPTMNRSANARRGSAVGVVAPAADVELKLKPSPK